MKIAFRADASLEMGTGHVMRCLTLAKQLSLSNHDSVFICRPHVGNLIEFIRAAGFKVISLASPQINKPEDVNHLAHGHWLGSTWQEDAKQSIQCLNEELIDCLVVDHYALDILWEQALNSVTHNVFVIDDLADRNHQCFALLDQNYGRSKMDYKNLLSEDCSVFIGPKYALLRPEFSALRDESLKRRDSFELKTILVNLGGVDQFNHTASILIELNDFPLPADIKIVVVLGATCPNIASVKAAAVNSPFEVEVKVGVSNMAELMLNSDLAIGAAGSTTWERFALGLPSILVSIASNQDAALEALTANGHIYSINLSHLGSGLKTFFETGNTSNKLKSLSNQCRKLCDANGVQTMAKEIEAISDW